MHGTRCFRDLKAVAFACSSVNSVDGDFDMYVVIVPIQIEQGHRDEFLEALMVDAKGANEDEPGCLRFDAVQDADDDHRIWLYEVYKDEAAFQAHLQAPHFQVFKEAADKWRIDGIQGSARGSKNLYPSDAEWR